MRSQKLHHINPYHIIHLLQLALPFFAPDSPRVICRFTITIIGDSILPAMDELMNIVHVCRILNYSGLHSQLKMLQSYPRKAHNVYMAYTFPRPRSPSWLLGPDHRHRSLVLHQGNGHARRSSSRPVLAPGESGCCHFRLGGIQILQANI